VKLNLVNLTVDDVPAARAFLAKFFGLEERYTGLGNKGFGVLVDDDDLVLTLIKGGHGPVQYPSSFHIGFGQMSEKKVDEMNQRLKADGFDVEPPSYQHGAWTFYFTAPGGFSIEVFY
jgi:catechol 2,3-dioxygenase-like lactoylglutathione lyase family enzyme